MNVAISRFMTKSPHTIGINATLAEARDRMNRYGLRHLPVLQAGALVGLLSQRDIQLLETLKDVDPKTVKVEEAMSQDALSVEPEASIAEVARRMAERRCGSAVIERRGEILGIFTTVDALNAINTLFLR
jgi:acetoin utilization protein AcuB